MSRLAEMASERRAGLEPLRAKHGPRALSASPALRRWSTAQAAWAGAIADGMRITPNALAAAQATKAADAIELERIDGARWSEADRWPSLWLELCGRPTHVRLAPHPQWQELEQPNFQRLERDLQLAIAAHLSHELRQGLGASLHIAGLLTTPAALPVCDAATDVSQTALPAMPQLVLAVRVHHPATPARADTAAPWLAWLRIDAPLAVAQARAPRSDGDWVDRCRFPVHAVLGQSHIAARDVAKQLVPGCVVLLDRVGPTSTSLQALALLDGCAIGWLSFEGWQPAALSAGSLAATPRTPSPHAKWARWIDPAQRRELASVHSNFSRSDPMTPSEPDADDEPNQHTRQASLSEATVQVQALLELPSARIADLQQWTPGTVLTTAAPVDGTQVMLRVGGQIVGRGRLVAVDALLGFELLDLFD
jgi:flagellar motor switch/type III secretory pathway protein FliN